MKRIFSALLVLPLLSGAAFADFTAVGGGNAFVDNATVTSTIVGSGGGTVTGVDLVIGDLNHTWAGDLIIDVVHDGVTVNLSDRPGFPATAFGSNVDLGGDYAFVDGNPNFDLAVEAAAAGGATSIGGGTFSGNDLLALFNGTSADGDWVLNISDNAGGDTGSYASWTLNVTTSGVPEPTSALVLLGLSGLALVRRRS